MCNIFRCGALHIIKLLNANDLILECLETQVHQNV